MSRTRSIMLLALTSLGLTACHGGDSKPAPSKTDVASTQAAGTPSPPPVATDPAAPAGPEDGFSEPPVAPGEAAPGPAPVWFRPDAFEHTAIIRQDLAGTRVPTGQTSAMIVLELPATTTPEQCIAQFRAKLAETVAEPPTASTMPQGHLSLRGKGDGYEYTVVCGMAKDKPTMFLSYSQ